MYRMYMTCFHPLFFPSLLHFPFYLYFLFSFLFFFFSSPSRFSTLLHPSNLNPVSTLYVSTYSISSACRTVYKYPIIHTVYTVQSTQHATAGAHHMPIWGKTRVLLLRTVHTLHFILHTPYTTHHTPYTMHHTSHSPCLIHSQSFILNIHFQYSLFNIHKKKKKRGATPSQTQQPINVTYRNVPYSTSTPAQYVSPSATIRSSYKKRGGFSGVKQLRKYIEYGLPNYTPYMLQS